MTTLAEYKYLGNDAEVRMGIAKVFIKKSPWLRELNFVELSDNNISRYKMETSDGGANVHEVDDVWSSVNPSWEYRDAGLAILGDNISVDKFGSIAAGPENAEAAMIELKTKGVAQTFDKLAVYGRTTSTGSLASTKNFKGLLRMIAECESDTTTDLDGWIYSADDSAAHNPQCIFAASGASAALTLVMLDSAIDAVPDATHICMSRLMLRKLKSLAQAAGNNLQHDKDQLGYPVTRYGEQIVVLDEQIKNNMNDSTVYVTAIASYDYTQAITTAKDTSPIFVVRMAEDGLCGINGKGMIQVEPLGTLEGADATGYRVKFYCGMRLTNKKAASVLLNSNYSG
jgi:hypothetical protein